MAILAPLDEIPDYFPAAGTVLDARTYAALAARFAAAFSDATHRAFCVASAPGRIELAGNHTDHQGGHVISGALPERVYALGALRACDTNADGPHPADAQSKNVGFDVSASADTRLLRADLGAFGRVEIDFAERDAFSPCAAEHDSSAALIRGMAATYLQGCPENLSIDLVVSSDLPAGAGFSSSAAFEVCLGELFARLAKADVHDVHGDIPVAGATTAPTAPDPLALALAAHTVERDYFGKQCGAQDQIASAFGGVVAMDFRPDPPRVEPLSFTLADIDYTVCLIDTGCSHAPYRSAFDAIPNDMRAVAGALDASRLCELSASDIESNEERIVAALAATSSCDTNPERAINRARHYFAEDERVAKQGACLASGDIEGFLNAMRQTDRSCRTLLQSVTPPHAPDDTTALLPSAILRQCDRISATGAWRIHGGGFGGSIIAFIQCEQYDAFRRAINAFTGRNSVREVAEFGRPAAAFLLPQNLKWTSATSIGPLEITINYAKPEKDPRAIAAAAQAGERAAAPASPASATLGCDLCREALNYNPHAERLVNPHVPADATSLPTSENSSASLPTPASAPWAIHYSPYAYFSEHCIFFTPEHVPLHTTPQTLARLIALIEEFPEYFVGCNADLPLVGGSILGHDHFQGGRHTFPLMNAAIEKPFALPGTQAVKAGFVDWPAEVIRLTSAQAAPLLRAATGILDAWTPYDDGSCRLRSATDGTRHNALTAIAYFRPQTDAAPVRDACRPDKSECGTPQSCVAETDFADARAAQPSRPARLYCIDLVLRNNRTTPDCPFGLFHPGENLHHIKKENIGLIEVMGRAILPPRVADGFPDLATNPSTRDAVAEQFVEVLRTTDVFRFAQNKDAARNRFLAALYRAML